MRSEGSRKLKRTAHRVQKMIGRLSFQSLQGDFGSPTNTEATRTIPSHHLVDKKQNERAERRSLYNENTENINKWHEVVLSNRNSKSIDLAGDKRKNASYRVLTKPFLPTTPFEREFSTISRPSTDISSQEMSDTAKLRSLMLYEQMKRRRANKIKSKAYRRLRRNKKCQADKTEEPADESDHTVNFTHGETGICVVLF